VQRYVPNREDDDHTMFIVRVYARMRVCVIGMMEAKEIEQDDGEVEERTETESTRTAFFPSGGAASPATCTTTPLSSCLYPLYPLFLSSVLRLLLLLRLLLAAVYCFYLLSFSRMSTSNAFLKKSHISLR